MPAFEIGTCYACNQGQVIIAVAISNGAWFVVCEECFSDWPDPGAFKAHAKAGFESFGRYRNAAKAEVMRHPWSISVENTADLHDE